MLVWGGKLIQKLRQKRVYEESFLRHAAWIGGKLIQLMRTTMVPVHEHSLFSPQWKFLIPTILHCLSLKSTSWNEFSINIASAVICLATNQKLNFSKLIFDGMLRNLDNTKKKFLMYPRFLMVFLNNQIELGEPFNGVYPTPAHNLKVFSNMSRKGVKFSGNVTPLFDSMLVPHQAPEGEGSEQPTEPQPTPSPT
ncbi:hypothetical protein Tco_1282687 [Tanacetum coccineum]